jgi:ornithine decarboxylase
MPPTNFAGIGIGITLKNFRQLISSFPKKAGSVAVISPYRITYQIQTWKKLLPNVKPYYAVKCNPEKTILQSVQNSGVGFDCASLREVYEVNTVKNEIGNEDRPDIIYAHPMKSERDICLVDSMLIETTVVDSVEECDKLYKFGWRGSAFARLAVEDSGSKMPFSSKFGASKEELQEIARSSKIPLSGVSFHVGSGCEEPGQYRSAIEYAAGEAFDILRKYGHNPKTIDIGGGFSSDLRKFKDTAKVISESIEKFVPKNRRVIAEPGRYIAQPSQDLFVKIIGKKPMQAHSRSKGWRYVIDESLYGHFSCIPFDGQKPAWIHIPSEERLAILNTKQESILFGRTCDSLDVIARGPMEEMEVGDWLYFPLMGAYTSATASEFNGFPKPASIIDLGDQLPTTETAWGIMDYMHDARPLTYSNTLPPIT